MMLQRAYEIRAKELGDDHPDTLVAASNLAIVHAILDGTPSALERCKEILSDRRRLLGDGHSDTLASMNNLAMLYVDLGMLSTAEELMIEVLTARQARVEEEPNLAAR
jgi:hypothetical protein